ncbi:MAG: hypothetical protein ACRDG6_13405 [Candidatus Limnocylindria bacterium]
MIPNGALRTSTALAAAAIMLVVAIGAGAAVGVITRPPPPTLSPTPVPTATPTPDTGPLVFKQPLTGGCATDDAVWVVSDGGGIGRFDRLRQRWELIDPTLRSLVAAACTPDTVLAVGAFGRVVTIDDLGKTIRADDIGLFDAYAVSLLPDGALVVGSEGSVQRQTSAGWDQYAKGIDEDLYGAVGFAGGSAWMVGAGGVSYRLERVGGDVGWKPYATGTTASLRTIAAASPTEAIAAGDDGVLLRFDGSWRPLESGVKHELRASARVGAITYVVGDGGTALVVEGNTVRPIANITTTCALRSVFVRGNEVWFVGSEGTLAGVWRQIGDRVERWGTC